MPAVQDDQRRVRAARVFAVLAILLGLLAMHGIASAHLAGATASEQGAVTLEHGAGAPSHQGAEAPLITAQGAGEVKPADLPCDGQCSPALAALCVALVATAAALALAIACSRRAGRVVVGPPLPVVSAPVSTSCTPSPPDPVRELCVSRT